MTSYSENTFYTALSDSPLKCKEFPFPLLITVDSVLVYMVFILLIKTFPK